MLRESISKASKYQNNLKSIWNEYISSESYTEIRDMWFEFY